MTQMFLSCFYTTTSKMASRFWSQWNLQSKIALWWILVRLLKKHQNIIPEILAAHALSGCDTVACCFGIGKKHCPQSRKKWNLFVTFGPYRRATASGDRTGNIVHDWLLQTKMWYNVKCSINCMGCQDRQRAGVNTNTVLATSHHWGLCGKRETCSSSSNDLAICEVGRSTRIRRWKI